MHTLEHPLHKLKSLPQCRVRAPTFRFLHYFSFLAAEMRLLTEDVFGKVKKSRKEKKFIPKGEEFTLYSNLAK